MTEHAERARRQFQVITLVGHLTADPVLKHLEDGGKLCQLRLAVNDRKDQPLFIDPRERPWRQSR